MRFSQRPGAAHPFSEVGFRLEGISCITMGGVYRPTSDFDCMPMSNDYWIDISQLRVGLYVFLDLGWLDHPFALSHFKIASEAQIEIIRGLGLAKVGGFKSEVQHLQTP
jgi:hypothetical protein